MVIDPNGRRARVPLYPFPFRMGRAPDNNLVLRDSRVSRNHAQIARSDGHFVLEDLGSRHGVWVNGERVEKSRRLRRLRAHRVRRARRLPDSLHARRRGDAASCWQSPASAREQAARGRANLEKLRAVLEVARSLQSSFSTDDVLNTVVDAALAVTGAERGFLLLFDEEHELQVRSARVERRRRSAAGRTARAAAPDSAGARKPARSVLHVVRSDRARRALARQHHCRSGTAQRGLRAAGACEPERFERDADALGGEGERGRALHGFAAERGRSGGRQSGTAADAGDRSLDGSRKCAAARRRARQAADRGRTRCGAAHPAESAAAAAARTRAGSWFADRARASHQVGGDYFDVVAIGPDTWSLVVADVSGKGVSSALLASFLQGAFLSASPATDIPEVLSRINTFLNDRAEHGKYATMFYSKLDSSGRLTYANAGHCAPLLVRRAGEIEKLEATSMPVGLVAGAPFALDHRDLTPGRPHRSVHGRRYGSAERRRRILRAQASCAKRCSSAAARIAPSCTRRFRRRLLDFTAGAEQADDLTLVVVEYRGADEAAVSSQLIQKRGELIEVCGSGKSGRSSGFPCRRA